jgi:hypothetical protein
MHRETQANDSTVSKKSIENILYFTLYYTD